MAFLLFPTQLFPSLSHLQNDSIKQIYLIEEPRYFTDFKYHKLKLAYHRASMKKYYDTLVKKKLKVKYRKLKMKFYSLLINFNSVCLLQKI